jgi:hypothetical protein
MGIIEAFGNVRAAQSLFSQSVMARHNDTPNEDVKALKPT